MARSPPLQLQHVLRIACRIDDLNKAAPGFFFLTQNAWWHDIILHIFRMTDENRKVLSIPKLKVPPGLANEFKGKLSMLKTASKFAHTLRNHYIAHRNRDVALQVRPVPESSVRHIRTAIAAIDDALHLIDNHFTSREPTMYEHLDMLGGANSLIWIIRDPTPEQPDRHADEIMTSKLKVVTSS